MNITEMAKAAAQSDSQQNAYVSGRILQYDADFGAYECGCWLDESVDSNIRALKKHIEIKRKLAGAQFVNNHITLGMKGGREQIATVKPYQAQRSGQNVEVKERVAILRNFLVSYQTENVTPVVNLLQEADDSMTQHQHKMLHSGIENAKNLSVIMSGDKDLNMAMGLHCDQKTGKMVRANGYGTVSYQDVGNLQPKLVGYGTGWFWHQLLMGDTADNIAGLPKISGKLANRYLPTKTYNPKRKALQCGEAKAVAILKGVRTDREAAKRCLEAYQGHYTNAVEMLVEQAFLLWMRRTGKPSDVINFLQESGLACGFSGAQVTALKEFKRLAYIQIKAGV
jgi:DNA polymerase-1